MSEQRTRFDLRPEDVPSAWFNIMPDLAQKVAPLPAVESHDQGADRARRPGALVPDEPDHAGGLDRPVDRHPRSGHRHLPSVEADPVVPATGWSGPLQTPARIYFKNESVSPAGSPQAEHGCAAGLLQQGGRDPSDRHRERRGAMGIIDGDGVQHVRAGMHRLHGEGLAVEQKPYRRIFMEMFGPTCSPRPVRHTNSGRAILAAASRLDRVARNRDQRSGRGRRHAEDTNYSLGERLGHVLLHQSVIGLEAAEADGDGRGTARRHHRVRGGGSNFAGLAYPFMAGKLRGQTPDLRFLATEPAACPTLTKGAFAYDYGDTAQIAPIVPMYTLGHDFVPAPVHAGGLRYHGDSPSLSLLVREGYMQAKAYTQNEIFERRGPVRQGAGDRSGAEPRTRSWGRSTRRSRRERPVRSA